MPSGTPTSQNVAAPAAWRAVALALIAATQPATAQTVADPPDRAAGAAPDVSVATDADIVVLGRRGEVVTTADPLATFDAHAIAAIGATSIGELLRAIQGVTQSTDGGPPIFLLNAQRVSGYEEIGNLPPEAIEKFEVLPEPVALRYGYPPTRRIVNFITKRRFRQLALKYVSAPRRAGARIPSTPIST